MASPALLAVALGLFVLLLAPTRRLQLGGYPPRVLGGYLVAMLVLGLAVALLPVSARFLVPILVLGYLAPFVVARTGLDRLRWGRRSDVTVERPPIRTVTGPVRDVPLRQDSVPPAEADDGAPAGSPEDVATPAPPRDGSRS